MTEILIAPEVVAPAWWKDMQFCHVVEEFSDHITLCGMTDHGDSCSVEYDGEAMCSECGNPTCPRCAQLAAAIDAMEEA